MTLAEFIQFGRSEGRVRGHLQVPGFSIFYARFGPRYLGKKLVTCLDIANIEVKTDLRGTGVFTRLMRSIRADYPDLTLYIECVLDESFYRHLLTIGFQPHEFHPDCVYLPGTLVDTNSPNTPSITR